MKVASAFTLAGFALASGMGCGGGDTTTIIQTTATTTAPAQTATTPTTTPPPTTTIPNPLKPEPGTVHIESDDLSAKEYHRPLRIWPTYDVQTKGGLSALFLMNNPNDCGAVAERFEDAPIGVQTFVDRAANEPRLQDEPISNAMLVYCQKFNR